ncbi:hypothetical protein OF385_13295 [Glutamicibacter sp. JL.03c]|uniref:N-acetylglucosamine kinase n=1 Tax=Glutamicibacter sp. JL.03c TaxID=2984842 RepID=UPI0021F7F2BE|nr:BadF/BadG/BcrA/BcrD ATPase family protein [Glutamicibacter sp. JL.03c]UYQ76980.1 hypothetical protein OF385_13295 [Glutamicibacter sp. JL.03c]
MQLPMMAVDGGQTGTKIRAVDESGSSREVTGPGIRTDEPLLAQVAGAVRQAMESTSLAPRVIAVGLSGLTRAQHDAAALRDELAVAGVQRVLLAHDSLTSYLGALGSGPGAVIAAGTGVVALGVGREAVARVDGWGHIMGDAGSGYWIGRRALDAVMRAHDGRGADTLLSGAVREHWPELDEAYIQLQSSPGMVSEVASLARAVARWAGSDRIAAQISRDAARELAFSAVTAAHRAHAAEDGSCRIAAMGGVFGNQVLRAEFARQLQALDPSVDLVPAAGSGLDGAQLLASLTTDHALWPMIRVS